MLELRVLKLLEQRSLLQRHQIDEQSAAAAGQQEYVDRDDHVAPVVDVRQVLAVWARMRALASRMVQHA
jgi:hypothetical protein